MVTKKAQYDMEYAKKKIKRVPVNFQNDYYKEVLEPAAQKVGMNMSAFIKMAIENEINKIEKEH